MSSTSAGSPPGDPPDPALPGYDPSTLRADLLQEYFAILEVVNGFDQRLLTVKGWSVTLSLALLGLGFQQGHYALFALAAVTGLGFWLSEALTKRHQMRYYSRMRDIELAAYNLNHVELPLIDPPRHTTEWPLGSMSSPRIDMYWAFPKGGEKDWRADIPWRRTPDDLRRMLRMAPWRVHVMVPHAIAIVLGLALYACALADVPGFGQLKP
jgi:hypothetical protein